MDARRPQTHYPPPPPSSIDTRVPPPPPFAHPPPATSYAAPPPGPALPPIQHQPYGPPGAAPDQTNLPSFRHHSQPPQHSHEPPREPSEPYPYVPLRGSGHATPAPVNRTYSHDSAAQRTPTTPVQHPPYPPLAASEGAPPPQHMEHGPHHAYPITNGTHGPPPPNAPPPPPPPPHHEQHPQYMTPVLETAHGPYGPPPQPMYPQHGYAGPISAAQFQVQRKKQMRATQVRTPAHPLPIPGLIDTRQACEQCRARKQKCDEGSPCSFCKENNLSCQYRDTPPAK